MNTSPIGFEERGEAGFSADGNVLAMFFGVATEQQSRQISRYIDEHRLDAGAPLRTCHPIYPIWQVFPFYFLAGILDYHRTLTRPWLGTLNAVNKARLALRAEDRPTHPLRVIPPGSFPA